MGDISKHFNEEDLECKCGCGYCDVDPILLDLLDEIYDAVMSRTGEAISINSCCRCYQHNLDSNGEPNSRHYLPPVAAADIDTSSLSLSVDQLAEIAEELDADGVGRYYDSNFVHVDVRDGRVGGLARWNDQE